MLPPIVFVVLTLEILMSTTPVPKDGSAAFDGPLSERRMHGVHPDHPYKFEFVVDSPGLVSFERRLKRDPIHVAVPGHKYLGWGLVTYPDLPGGIFLTSFNVLLGPHEQPLGPYRASTADGIIWAWSVLDHYGLEWNPRNHMWTMDRDELIEAFRRNEEALDWKAVAELLRSTGRPVPDDLFADHP